MTDKRVEREQRMFDTLKEISKGYMTPKQMRRNAEKSYGIDYEEMLEYAYENIQQLAALAIKGMRRPAQRATAAGSPLREGEK